MGEVVVAFEGVSFTYPNRTGPALDGIDLEVERGSCTLLTGMSGSGKSTLVRCMNGLIPHVYRGRLEGRLTVDGMDVLETPVWRLAGSVGMVFQDAESQLFTLVVGDEVAFGPENRGLSTEEIRRRVKWSLEVVGLEGEERRYVFDLSDGQKQRLAVAACLASMPDVFVFDEPMSNMDPPARREFVRLLSDLKNRWDKTIVIVDHRLQGLEECIDRVVIMQEGRIALVASADVLCDGEVIKRFGLRGYGTSPEWGSDRSRLAPRGAFREVDENMHEGEAVVMDEVSFSYGNGFGVEEVSLVVHHGEVVGIVGGNGSGKTTLLKLMVGLLAPHEGRVLIDGKEVRDWKTGGIHAGVALVLQNPDHQLFAGTVDEEVTFFRNVTGESAFRQSDVEDALYLMDLSGLRSCHPHSLSRGEKQRVAIAAALARRPRVLLLDEPTSGMDGRHLESIKERVKALKRSGTAVVVASHDEELILDVCDRVIMLEDGKVKYPVEWDAVCRFFHG